MSITQSLIKYYINFLETDFKQERSPKRKFTGKESFLDIGSRCGEIAQLIFSKLSQTYTDEEDIVFEIAKGKYFVKSDSSKIEKILNSIKDFFDIQGNIIKGYLVKQELDKKLKLNQETIQKISGFVHKSEFIDFFRDTEYLEVLQNIEKTHFTDSGEILLGNIRGDEEGNKEYIDQENKNHPLINYLFKELSDTITEEDRNILSSLSTYQEVEDFLKSIKSKDIFYILQDIDKDRKSNEKFEIFFNFFEIKISNNITNRSESFPLFFIQCDLEYANSCFTIKLSKTINFNRKLVRYLTQKIEGGIDWSLSPSEGIFAQSKNFINDVNTKISDLLNKIQISQKITLENNNVFELKKLTVEKNIATYQELRQIYQQHSLEISNNCCFCVDEKEFVLIDPETLPDNDRNIIYGFIENTIDNILSGNPKNHNKEIQHKVDRMSVEDKLSYISPIPLNEQQIQILTALETEGCNNIIVEGPPGTGKSHSIVAILQHCIKNNKKVLFVSDKKEALDVVEEKINNVFDNGNLKAPIIRIGGSSGEKNFGKLLSTSYIESLETYKQKNHPPSEEQLDSHKKGIQEKIQTEINLVKKIIDNLGNIQYYLEHEEMCENILNNFFVETDRNKQDIVTLLKYIHGLSSVNNTLLRDFNIFEIHTTCIEAEKKVFETIISCIEQIKNTIEAATPETLELMVQNFNQDVSFAQIKKNYKKRFGKDLQTFINNYFDNFDNEELDTFEQIEVFCKKVDFIRQSLENITIHNIKNISLKDIKSKDKIKEISNLVEEYHKIYTQFFGITKIFKKTKLETIAQNIKQLCGNSNFDVVDFEKVKNIKENDLVELQKIYCLDDKPDFDFTSYIKKLNTIKEQKIDLSLFEDTEQYFNLTSFESFGINNLDGYILLDDVFGIITTIKKIFGNIQRLKNRTFGLLNINLENIIEKIVPSNITILSNYEYIETIGTIRNECETMINTLENLNRFLGAFDIEDIQAKCLDFKLSLKKNKININSIKTFH
ncbi:MAG: hypothetical protein NZL83_04100, partial [Candidatus Absconditabacterales bacterium]|nr:hypothetical protein [Candidatus Absconditabacterales bacterium]